MPRKSGGDAARKPAGAATPKQPTPRRRGDALTPQQEEYCRLRASGLSQVDAFTQAYPSASGWSKAARAVRACGLEKVPAISDRLAAIRSIAERESEISVARLRRELGCIALFDIRRLVDASGHPKRLDEIDEDTARALSGIDAVTIGNADVGVGAVLKFRVSDKIQAIKELLKLSGAYETDNKQKGQAAGEAAAAGLREFLTGLSASGCALPMAQPRRAEGDPS